MESVTRHVKDIDSADRQALPDWCNVYEGLSDDEIRNLEQTILTRIDLTRTTEGSIDESLLDTSLAATTCGALAVLGAAFRFRSASTTWPLPGAPRIENIEVDILVRSGRDGEVISGHDHQTTHQCADAASACRFALYSLGLATQCVVEAARFSARRIDGLGEYPAMSGWSVVTTRVGDFELVSNWTHPRFPVL